MTTIILVAVLRVTHLLSTNSGKKVILPYRTYFHRDMFIHEERFKV